MESTTHATLSEMMAAIDKQTAVARDCGLSATASLLEMAKLEAQLHLYGVSQQQFEAFCGSMAERIEASPQPPRRPTGGRPRNAALRTRPSRNIRETM